MPLLLHLLLVVVPVASAAAHAAERLRNGVLIRTAAQVSVAAAIVKWHLGDRWPFPPEAEAGTHPPRRLFASAAS